MSNKKSTSKKSTSKKKSEVVEVEVARNKTVRDIATALNMKEKNVRRILRAETRDAENDLHHKNITRATRYAFSQAEVDAIVERISAKRA